MNFNIKFNLEREASEGAYQQLHSKTRFILIYTRHIKTTIIDQFYNLEIL